MRKIKNVLLVLALSLAIVGCNNQTEQKPEVKQTEQSKDNEKATNSEVKEMTGEELDKIEGDNKEKENYFVIDVRSAEEYNAGHVRHAVNIPLDKIDSSIDMIKERKEANVVTICNTGKKSSEAAKKLASIGKTVFNAQGVKDYQYKNIVKFTTLTGKEFAEATKASDIVIIDARDEKDYKAGHIKGAINMGVDNIDPSKVEKGKKVYTYCYSGNKSGVIADKLSQEGYEVYNALDGTKEFNNYELVTE